MSIVLENIEGITINGINLANELSDNNDIQRDYFIVNSVYGRGVIGLDDELIYVSGMDGAYSSAPRRNPRYLDVKITVKGNSFGHLRKKIERLNEILSVRHEVEITFDDEKDRSYYGKIYAVDGDYESACVYQTLITFLCSDPYKYGQELTQEFTQDSAIVENPGTAPAKPIFELTAKQSVTFAMISDGDRYNMIGRPVDVNEQVVDDKSLIVDEHGETLNMWTTAGTSVDRGNVSGSYGYDGTGITVASHGTGTRWHGPALIREIDPIQDFEIEMIAQGITSKPTEVYRIEFYLFDESMNPLGKMTIMDNERNMHKVKAEGRYGAHVEGSYPNYIVNQHNYSYVGARFYGILRFKRVGNLFTLYVSRLDNNLKHIEPTLSQTYVDARNELAGKLKFIQIHTAMFAGTDNPYSSRINSIKVYELLEITEDQTPYIAHEGDVFTFDHINNELLLNGEDVKRLKDFGGSYFTLPKGYTTLTVLPEGAFDTRIRFRDRYK